MKNPACPNCRYEPINWQEEREFITKFLEWFARDGSVGGLDQLTENYEEMLKRVEDEAAKVHP